jgi:hypothetical protein
VASAQSRTTAVQELLGTLSSRGVNELLQGYQRPAADEQLVDQFGQTGGTCEKDENWLYVEFYGQDELWAKVQGALADGLRTKHELTADVFLSILRDAGRGVD